MDTGRKVTKNKPTKTKAKKKAWSAFSLYIRLRDAIETNNSITIGTCCSCGTVKQTSGRTGLQAGHFIPGRHSAVLFNEDVTYSQCFQCNMRMQGNWVGFYEFMVKRVGEDRVKEMVKTLSKKNAPIIKYSLEDYQEIEKKYKQKVKELREAHGFKGS